MAVEVPRNDRRFPAALLIGSALWGCSQNAPHPPVAGQPASAGEVVERSLELPPGDVEARPARPAPLMVPSESSPPAGTVTAMRDQTSSVPSDEPAVLTTKPEPVPQTPAETAFHTLLRPGTSAEAWEAAHELLVSLGAEAAPVLREGLRSSNPLAREWSAAILTLNSDAGALAVNELKACLSDRAGYVRANAAAALMFQPGQEAITAPVLVELMTSPDANLRRMAALNLGNLSALPPTLVAQVAAALHDGDAETVRPLVDLLGRSGASARPALPRLQQIAFEQSDTSLQSAAQQAVQLIEAGN